MATAGLVRTCRGKAPIQSKCKNKSLWIDYCGGDICRHLLLLAQAPLPSAGRKEDDVCAVKMSDRHGGTYALFSFKNVFLLSLFSSLPVQGTPSLVGTK